MLSLFGCFKINLYSHSLLILLINIHMSPQEMFTDFSKFES